MFRHRPDPRRYRRRFPRIRGDVPCLCYLHQGRDKFSPHTRGCSVSVPSVPPMPIVFPAYAGMFRVAGPCGEHGRSFPRIRGDVPDSINAIPVIGGFSPHTRGCSALPQITLRQKRVFPHTRGCSYVRPAKGGGVVVFPAYAGMFLGSFPSSQRQ